MATPLEIHHRLDTDFAYYAEHAPLMIKPKEGGELLPFRMNRAQRYIHERLETQLKEKGWVRALLLKGRQQGGSTYVNARFYHKTSRHKGKSVFILSHEGKTTDKLFDMVKRFHDNVHPALRPREGKSNTRQLAFPDLGSDYAAGTAGNEQVGRGGTAQLFHGSEAAYWEHAYEIQNGALESIGLVPGTEIILESTANGPLGLFYDKCQLALAGVGDYILIFVPWFWQEEYTRLVPHGTEFTEEELKYAETYLKEFPRAVMEGKLYWRRNKIISLATGDNLESGQAEFRHIYPSNPVEAFQASGVSLFRPDAIMAARTSTITDETAPKIAGVDPAGDSDNSDRTVIALRQGRHVYRIQKYPRMRPMELAGILAGLIKTEDLDMVFVDRGYGEGTIDRLHELGFARRVQGIAFNERPLQPEIYMNKRSEIIIEAAKWLNAGDVRIPNLNKVPVGEAGGDEIHADLAAMPLDEGTSNGLRFLKSKREIKKLLGRSPDIVDAIALTFSYPVRRELGVNGFRKAGTADGGNGGSRFKKAEGSLTTMAKFKRRR